MIPGTLHLPLTPARLLASTVAADEGACPACAGAMPAHHMGAPLRAAHQRHEGADEGGES